MPFDGLMDYGRYAQYSYDDDYVDAIVGDDVDIDQYEIDELEAMLDRRLSIDDDVRDLSDDAEEQAVAALRKSRELQEAEALIEEEYEKRVDHLTKLGARDFGFDADNDNLRVTEVVDDAIDWYEASLQSLKDDLAEKLRSDIDALNEEGVTIDGSAKDSIYDDLVDAEVIEQWEPLLF